METLTFLIDHLPTILFAIFILAGLILVAAFIIISIGERNAKRAKEYQDSYKGISGMVDTYPVNEWNFETILAEIDKIEKLKYKNHEMTGVLNGRFYMKFASAARAKVGMK
jgi:hypothetical protein